MKKLRSIQRSAGQHWVGNGFPVRTLFAYPNLGPVLSPFLLLDYAGPATFEPTSERRGVGAHPHRGLRDGHDRVRRRGGAPRLDGRRRHRIGPGDVQWMTAASGIVHEEFHGREYARRGGPFEMVQLWVNLPAQRQEGAAGLPGHPGQPDTRRSTLPRGQGSVRVIAGEFDGASGPAKTFTPMQSADLRLSGDGATELVVRDGWTTALVVLKGELRVNGGEPIRAAEVGLFDRPGARIRIDAAADARALLPERRPDRRADRRDRAIRDEPPARDPAGDRRLRERPDGTARVTQEVLCRDVSRSLDGRWRRQRARQ